MYLLSNAAGNLRVIDKCRSYHIEADVDVECCSVDTDGLPFVSALHTVPDVPLRSSEKTEPDV